MFHVKKFSLDSIISTFFGIGKFPIMPGTLASFVSTILVALIFYQPHFVEYGGKKYLNMGAGIINPNYIIYVISFLAVLFYIIGVWASEKYSKRISIKDPSSVVIDEVAGIFTAFSLISITYALMIYFNEKEYILYLIISYYFFPVVFVLFRIFDIIKPWHIGRADKKYTGGFGIMIDDIIAGIYSFIAFYLIFFALKYSGTLDSFIKVN